MYVQGFIVPVPEGKQAQYVEVAQFVGDIMVELGAIEIVEAWEDDIKDGEQTDFRMAVKAQPGEKIVFSWVIWPDKETAETAHEKMTADERFQGDWEMPFDGKRMIFGGFKPVWTAGRP